MFRALADLATDRPRRILLATLAALLVAAAVGGPVAGLLNTGDAFTDPDAESRVAAERLARAAGAQSRPGYIALVRPGTDVRSAAGRARVRQVARELEAVPGMARTQAADGGHDALISRDGRATVVLGFLRPGADADAATEAVEERLRDEPGVSLGGGEPTGQAAPSPPCS